MNNKIAVIIPVYNSEKFLQKCIDSVLSQKKVNLEVICIDDCSTDNSYCILESYLHKDKRVIVFRNAKNKGPSFSRNVALSFLEKNEDFAYFIFVDSDDYLFNQYYLYSFYKLATENNGSFVFSNISMNENHETIIDKVQLVKGFSTLNYEHYICNKFYSVKKYAKFRFNESLTYREDSEFFAECISITNLCIYTFINGYVYNNNTESITRAFNYDGSSFLENFKSLFHIFDLLKDVEIMYINDYLCKRVLETLRLSIKYDNGRIIARFCEKELKKRKCLELFKPKAVHYRKLKFFYKYLRPLYYLSALMNGATYR